MPAMNLEKIFPRVTVSRGTKGSIFDHNMPMATMSLYKLAAGESIGATPQTGASRLLTYLPSKR